ncbi:hypothetical protein [Limosilactobacillus mucosae]|jgi:hypothetical protein|uniref:hypothetical protein n=1 Tax=Limosilactobacillus mucosae TaxID=97478 RepID=UPI001F56EF8A|nr:hypothetical protein [Limosilactobacillus mucosae]UNL61677.1 hypothetical protein G8B17_04900 [Limosilactobacillus mucosae]
MDHQPDMRDWSFAKRALAEIQQAKRKKWYSFWVQVELPDGKKTLVSIAQRRSVCNATARKKASSRLVFDH